MLSIIDIIIPRTDTPGAIDLNLNKFIDVYIEEVLYKKEKENFLKGLDICKKNIQIVDEKSLKGLLDKYLKIDDNLVDKYDDMISDFEDDLKNGRNSVLDENILEYTFIKKLPCNLLLRKII